LLPALLLLLSAPALSQQGKPQAPPAEPPEEDAALKEKEYSFNPLQASKELKIGDFYFKKGSWKAAALRYEEATKWNFTYAEAWLRLGEAREKLKDDAGAREAFAKFIELAPEHKRAVELKKKLK
jgi:tetratricopeptide (TPR) repeat protein